MFAHIFTSTATGVRAQRPGRPVREYAANGTVDHAALRQLPIVDQSRLQETRAEPLAG